MSPIPASIVSRAQHSGGALRAIVALGCVIALAAQCAALAYAIIAPIGPIGAPAAIARASGEALIDAAALTRFDPFFRSLAVAESGAPDPSAMGLKLFAARSGGADGGGAIIEIPGRGQRAFSIGETVVPGLALKAVGAGVVTLERDGQTFDLRFPEGGAPAPRVAEADQSAETGDATLRLATSLDPLALIGELALQARVEDGEVTGYTLREGPIGPALARLGLQAGDVLIEVNNRRLVDDERVSELRDELLSRPESVIRYERGGELRTATIRMQQP